jgi:hypothetical protein
VQSGQVARHADILHHQAEEKNMPMTRKFIMHRVVPFFSLAALLGLTGCAPCGCSDSTLEDAMVQILDRGLTSAHFHFDSPLIGQNTFTLRLAFAGRPPVVVTGPYDASGDTITFRPIGGTALGIVGGTKYKVTCERDPNRMTIEVNGNKLTFNCGE